MPNFIKKMLIESYLKKWRKLSETENRDGVKVKRIFRTNELFVDIYWIIIKNGKEDTIYERVKWEFVKETVEKVESTEIANL